jgi:F-type H+-transporting ATPase subunit a
MADSLVPHIKDAYYFEVPRFLWRYHFTSLDQVPDYLVKNHPHATVADFNRELTGKVLIPQPFGTLKNLYQKESGFAISKFMILELVVAIFLTLIFIRLASMMRKDTVPKGRFWHAFEAVLVYLREDVAKPAIGDHDADRFVPLLWTMFFFILGLNLFGLVPWAGSATGSFAVTLALAAVTLTTVLLSGVGKFGPFGFLLNLVPHMDMPWYMMVLLWPPIFLIEFVGLLIRHAILAVRLLANMVAGHLVMLGILGLAFTIEAARSPNWTLAAIVSVIGTTLFCCLELFVALLQAYVFTFLSALFIGSAVHKH